MRKKHTISKILKLKDSKKKELELEVKEAADKADEEKERLNALEKDYKDNIKVFMRQQEGGTADAGNVISFYEFFSRINGRIEEQKKVHDQRLSELSLLENHLINAHKEKKMFEVLEEKAVKEEIKEKEVAERKETDFFTLARRKGK
jgi:flagellar export protein FliJ